MSVVGFDIGSSRAIIAVARSGGIDVICNEVSDRATPCMVSFDAKRRFLGESAKTQHMSNFKNTVLCLNRFLGRRTMEPDMAKEFGFWTCDFDTNSDSVKALVSYKGERTAFSITEIMAMFLGKLKTTVQSEIKTAVSDCVISVPVYYTESQRRAMLDACNIAGLNCLRLLNDTTATALCYGLTKNEQFSDQPRHVCFVDVGYSGTKTTVVSFTKGNLEVKSNSFDKDAGGRDFDELMMAHFSKHILSTYNQDLRSNPRAVLRLRTLCEKVKKILSGISSTKADLETESRDFSLEITRDEFERLAAPLLERIERCIVESIKSSGLDVSLIHSVELVGGATRIPCVKRLISQIFNRDVSTTLNQDESVARGCAFQCAIESPSFKVREFGVKDIITFPLDLSWKTESAASTISLFPRQTSLPCSKPIFISEGLPIDLVAAYSDLSLLPPGTDATVLHGQVMSSSPIAPDTKVAIDVCINAHGLIGVVSAKLVEEAASEGPVDNESAAKKTAKACSEQNLTIVMNTSSLSPTTIQSLREAEYGYILSDKYAQDLDDSRNSLEEFVYELRSKLDNSLREYASSHEKEQIVAMLDATESWLYTDNLEESKDVYLTKLTELKAVVQRFQEHLERPQAEAALRQMVSLLREKLDSVELSDADLEKISSECNKKILWLDSGVSYQNTKALCDDPLLTSKQINDQREQLLTISSVIFARAKPKKVAEEAPKGDAEPVSLSAEPPAMALD